MLKYNIQFFFQYHCFHIKSGDKLWIVDWMKIILSYKVS